MRIAENKSPEIPKQNIPKARLYGLIAIMIFGIKPVASSSRSICTFFTARDLISQISL
jgi:hypothetical protein